MIYTKLENTYNTTLPDKVIVIDKVKVKSPIAVELCVKGFLYDYRYRNNKEYYKLSIKEIMKVINKCNNMLCGKNKLLSREKANIKHSDNDEIYGLLAISKDQEKDFYDSQRGGNKLLYQQNKDHYFELINII